MNFKETDFLRELDSEVEGTNNRRVKPLTKVGFKRYAKESTYKYENLLVEARFNEQISKVRLAILADFDKF